MAGITAATTAFREAYMSSQLDDPQRDAYNTPEARRMRYAVYWGFYENNAYRTVNKWSQAFKSDYGLYQHTRGIYNPSFRLVEFYASHLMGGALDMDAGDGEATPNALPIRILGDRGKKRNKALRGAIAQVWLSSQWAANREIFTRYGPLFGDVALKIVDDPQHQQVRIEIVKPGTITELTKDPQGNIKGYVIDEMRPDPRPNRAIGKQAKLVTYTEIATRQDGDVIYTTYLNGDPYPWNGESASWAMGYGFIPMVAVQHLNVGLDWGWGELHQGITKIAEVDDIASKANDHIRKNIDPVWLFTGVRKGDSLAIAHTEPTANNREPGRQELPALYAADPNAKATAVLAPLDSAGVNSRIDSMLRELERDYPELQLDIWGTGDPSGRAMRIARQRATTKLLQRRDSYDNALMRAHQMAIAIGGERGYPGYSGFGLDSFAAGDLNHAIGQRPVFSDDPLDAEEIEAAFYANVERAVKLGMNIRAYLADHGWDEERIDRLLGPDSTLTNPTPNPQPPTDPNIDPNEGA